MRAKESGQSPLLLLDVIEILNKERLPYAVIGAMAVSFYGVVRSSLDADAIIQVDKNSGKIDNLRAALTKAGWQVVIKRGDFEDPLVGVVLIEDNYGNHVDLVLGLKKGDNNLFKRVRPVEFQGETINIVGVEDLIVMKVFAGSHKDMMDAQGVLTVSERIIDRKKLLRLAGPFGDETVKTIEKMLGRD